MRLCLVLPVGLLSDVNTCINRRMSVRISKLKDIILYYKIMHLGIEQPGTEDTEIE